MVDLRIDLELSPTLRALDDLKRKQIPFATALALTRTAQHAQREIKRDLPRRFELRSPFVERGVRIEAATKAKLEAAVLWRGPQGSKFGLSLARQETGGSKRPYSRAIPGGYLALPRDVKRDGRGIIPRSQRPGALLKRKRVYIQQDAGRGAAIMQRGTKGAPPVMLYYLEKRPARIKPRFHFRETAVAAARKVFKKEFGKAFAKAIASRRP